MKTASPAASVAGTIPTTITSATTHAPGIPARLIIPSINVNASIESLGLTPQGAVDVPKGPYDVAWFDVGPLPGQKGSAVISGHYGPWLNGAASVFDNLSQLKPGDKVYVQDTDGSMVTFVVQQSKTYAPNAKAPEVFNPNDAAYLNLITCNGTWLPGQKTYDKRLVVFTKELSQ